MSDNSINTFTFTTTNISSNLAIIHCKQEAYCEKISTGLMVKGSDDNKYPTQMGWRMVHGIRYFVGDGDILLKPCLKILYEKNLYPLTLRSVSDEYSFLFYRQILSKSI